MGWPAGRSHLRPRAADPRPDGAKLSKRHGALGVDAYRDEMGILPEALFNYLLRLGWGHGDDEIISARTGRGMVRYRPCRQEPSRFDLAKLQNLNGHYMREADDARLAELVAPRMTGTIDLKLLARDAGAESARQGPQRTGRQCRFPVRHSVRLSIEDKAAALLTEDARALLGSIETRIRPKSLTGQLTRSKPV
jgi:glutamyl-tRNA synthetase